MKYKWVLSINHIVGENFKDTITNNCPKFFPNDYSAFNDIKYIILKYLLALINDDIMEIVNFNISNAIRSYKLGIKF